MNQSNNIFAVVSGKGGVGKTWLAITLAQTAAKAGQRVLLMDGDIGLANVDIQLGIAPTRDLTLWALGKADLKSLVMPTDAGFDLIPGASGSGAMAGLSGTEVARLAGDFAGVAADYDLALIDVAAGADPAQIRLAGAARRCILVITEDPTSLTDGYAFMKIAQRLRRPPKFEVVVNMAERPGTGANAHTALARACNSFLKLDPPLLGVIQRDTAVVGAIKRQTPLLNAAPGALAAREVANVLQSLKARPARAA